MSAELHKTAPFSWTNARTEAAVLVAEDELSDEEIATRVGVVRRTLATWKQHPAFRERVAGKVAELDAAVSRFVIAKRRERVRILDEQQTKLLQVQVARAGEYADIPGGSTGLLVKQVKIAGGETPIVIDEYVVDTGLMAEIRATQKQAAQELGQWSEKSSVTHAGGIRREIVVVADGDTATVDVTERATFADIEAEVEALFAEDPHPEDAG